MAQLGSPTPGDLDPWGQLSPGHISASSLYENDWARMELPSPIAPLRHRRTDLHRAAYSAYSAAPSSVATSHPRPAPSRAASLLLASPRGMRHHSSASPLVGRPSAAPVSFSRSSTAPTGKRATAQTRFYDGGRSRSVSHRDPSPRSTHPNRSTPDSRRSVRSSFDDSDKETDTTESSRDDDDGKGVFVDKDALRSRLDPRHRSTSRLEDQADQRGGGGEPQQHQDRQREQAPSGQSSQQGTSRRQQNRRSSESRGAGTGRSRSRSRRRDNVIYEEDAEEQATENVTGEEEDSDRPARRTPTRQDTRRSVSRHTTATQATRPVPKRGKSLRRSDSFDESWKQRSASRRPSRRYCETEIPESYTVSPLPVRKAAPQPTAPSHAASSPVSESSVLGGFVGLAPTSGTPSTHHGCAICHEDYPVQRMAKLNCGHRMCTSCLRDKFTAAVSDPRSMPPRCCSAREIPLKYVDRLFDANFKRTWNQKFREYSTQTRVHCPRCKEWIKPDDMYSIDDRRAAMCSKCRTRMCCACNGVWHNSYNCPRKDRSSWFMNEPAGGWQRCYRCRSRMPLQDSQDHMTCDNCGAESCMICGTKWKTCDCAIFDCDGAADASRSEYTVNPFNGMRGDHFPPVAVPSVRDFHPRGTVSAAVSVAAPAPPDEDTGFLRQRKHDFRDQDLARRMHSAFDGFGDDSRSYHNNRYPRAETPRGRIGYYDLGYPGAEAEDPSEDELDAYPRRHAESDFGVYTRGGRSFFDDSSRQRPATVILPSVPQPPSLPKPPTPPQQVQAALHPPSPSLHLTPQHQQLQHQPQHLRRQFYDTTSPFAPSPYEPRSPLTPNYYSPRARASSRDRRMADRFNVDYRSSPIHRLSAPPPSPGAATMSGGGMPMMLPPMGPMGHATAPPMTTPMGPPMAPPMTSLGPLTAPPRAAMGGMPMMPMASMPPPMALEPPLLRRNPMEGPEMYDSPAWPEWTPYGGMEPYSGMDYHTPYEDMEAEPYGMTAGGSKIRNRRALREEQPRSMMAGLTGPDRGMGRVDEWLTYIEPGHLEGEADSVLED